MTEHTKEPWFIHNYAYPLSGPYGSVRGADGMCLWDVDDPWSPDVVRYVACVNACAGMEDPEREIAMLRERVDAAERKEAAHD